MRTCWVCVYLILWLGIATPDNEHAAHQSACMSDTRRGDLSGGLQHSSGEFSGRDEVNIVPDLFSYETTKEEKLARSSCSGGKGMPVSWEG